MIEKTCIKHGVLNHDQIQVMKNGKLTCRLCMRISKKIYNDKNKEKNKKYFKEWYKKNYARFAAVKRKYYLKSKGKS